MFPELGCEPDSQMIQALAGMLPGKWLVVNKVGKVVFSSRAATSLLGEVFPGLVGMPCSAILPDLALDWADAAAEPRGVFSCRNPATADGRIEVSIDRIAAGESLYYLLDFGESELKIPEENWFRLAVEAAPEAMLLVDSKGKIRFANSQTQKLFGVNLPDLLGKSIETLLPERHRHLHHRHRDDFMAAPEARPMGLGRELFGLHSDGREIPVEIGLNPMHRNGEIFVLASIVDISPRKKMESRLIQTQKLEGLGVLAGGIAHDFNNILTGIRGYADLALMELGPASPVGEKLQRILTGSQRGAELVRQMLAYAGKSRFQSQALDLSPIVQEMAQFLNASISKNSVMDLQLDSLLPAMEGDATQVRQVVMNLITNASEALSGQLGVITIRTGSVPDGRLVGETLPGLELQNGPHVFLEVKDNGCGMDEEVRARIFDPFFTTKSSGRGLGLSAVLGIVKAHKGALSLSSEAGSGTVFKVFFPSVGRAEKVGEPIQRVPIKGDRLGTVLVVDDEDQVRGMAAAMLRHMGYQTVLAEDGMDALEVFSRDPDLYCLVLLDMTMPRMNGLQAMAELKARRPEVRVLLSSGYGVPESLDLSPTTGFAGFLPKPYSYDELAVAVRDATKVSKG